MSRLIVPSRKLWTPPQRQRGVMVLDAYRFGGGGGGGGEWVTAIQWTPDPGGFANWAGLTFRLVVPASDLVAGSRIRLTCRAASSYDITVGDMYIAHAASTGDDYDFESTPSQVLFGGNGSVTISGNSEVVSDEVIMPVSTSKNLIISAYVTNGRSCRIATLPGWVTRYKSGSDAATVDAAGYSTSAYAASLVRRIEVFVPG